MLTNFKTTWKNFRCSDLPHFTVGLQTPRENSLAFQWPFFKTLQISERISRLGSDKIVLDPNMAKFILFLPGRYWTRKNSALKQKFSSKLLWFGYLQCATKPLWKNYFSRGSKVTFKTSETPRNAVHGTLAGRVHKSIDQSSQMALKGTKSADLTNSESRQELTELDTRVSHNYTFSSILMGAQVFPIPSCPLSPNIAKKPVSVTYFRYMSTSTVYQNFDFLHNLKKK